jgi:glycosyltransferase involved in cell wall biosynthesis
MRILSIHNSYQIRGGEDESRELEERLLQEHGHHVSIYEESNDQVAQLNALQLVSKTVWSAQSYQTVKQHLQNDPYNLIHVQNFFPLISPSVYYAAKAAKVPVVQTLRNYRLLCPNALFFRDGQVCEDCLGKAIPYPGVVNRCYRENLAASAGVATMLTIHRSMKTWTNLVDVYITLTEFARQKFIEGGFPADKIVVKPNFVHPDPQIGSGTGGFALYVGRLSVEKGIDTLLSAWEKLDTPFPLKIVGDGPLADQVIAATQRLPHIQWLGRRTMPEVHELMGQAMMLIFPSKWYETFGRVAVESFAKGTPVIAAQIGAIAELVESGHTGLLFRPGDANDLARQVQWALAHPQAFTAMRQATRAEFLAKYTAQANYQRLMEIYQIATVQTTQSPALASHLS